MRLVCPNCDAEYEVDADAIPLSGRDVQCSNCGHAWFQLHPDAPPEEDLREEDLPQEAYAEDDIDEDVYGAEVADWPPAEAPAEFPAEVPVSDPPPAASAPVTEAPHAPVPSAPVAEAPARPVVAAPAPVFPPPPVLPPEVELPPEPDADVAVTRVLDESVLAVLREEAAREAAARRAEAPPLPATQTELPLEPVAAAAAGRLTARLRAEDAPRVEPVAPRPRRDLLPAIEEINSSLRASTERGGLSQMGMDHIIRPRDEAPRGGFGQGVLMAMLLAVVLLAIYVLAPLIGSWLPALAGPLQAYVAAVDAARLWLDAEIKTLIRLLQGLVGSAQG